MSSSCSNRSRAAAGLRWGKAAGLCVLAALGCRDLDRFDTGESGAYCGKIVDGAFTRSGFNAGLGMRLTLDIDALQSAPGTLSTDDRETGPCAPQALLEGAPLRVTPALFADPLSLLEFGATRDHNFVAWVESACQGSMLAVVSLMHTGDTEVRLLRPGTPSGADTSGTDTLRTDTPGNFGVFQLRRTDCEF
ncbi:MAG: hypothetical protein RL033_248 [Pseudomonadota bacterium]